MVSHNTAELLNLWKLEVANAQGDAIVVRKEVMCNLLCQQR